MKFTNLFFICLLISSFSFISCDKSEDMPTAPKIKGSDLKGEWLMDLGENYSIFTFPYSAKVYKTIVTPRFYINKYAEGNYFIEEDNLIIYLKEFAGTKFETVKEHEWECEELSGDTLKVKELYEQKYLFKISDSINIEMSKDSTYNLNSIFTNDNICNVYSYDTAFVKPDVDNNTIIGVAHGKTYIRVTLQSGRNVYISVNVISKENDSADYYHKALGCRKSLLEHYFGTPYFVSNSTVGYKTEVGIVHFNLNKEFGVDFVDEFLITYSNNISDAEITDYLKNNYKTKSTSYSNINGTIWIKFYQDERKCIYMIDNIYTSL